MLNFIPVLGWLICFICYSSMSVPFWYCWTVCGLGAKYFYFLPAHLHSIQFWDCVGLTFCIVILKTLLLPRFGSTIYGNTRS